MIIYDPYAPFELEEFILKADFKTAAGILLLFVSIAALTLVIGYGLNSGV